MSNKRSDVLEQYLGMSVLKTNMMTIIKNVCTPRKPCSLSGNHRLEFTKHQNSKDTGWKSHEFFDLMTTGVLG